MFQFDPAQLINRPFGHLPAALGQQTCRACDGGMFHRGDHKPAWRTCCGEPMKRKMNGLGGSGGENHVAVICTEFFSNLKAGPLQCFRGFQTKSMKAGGISPGLILGLDHALKHPRSEGCSGASIEINHTSLRIGNRVGVARAFAVPGTPWRC